MVAFVEFCHDADPAPQLFIEVDSLKAGKLEDPVDRAGDVKTHLGGDISLDMTVQRVAGGEVAEVSAFHPTRSIHDMGVHPPGVQDLNEEEPVVWDPESMHAGNASPGPPVRCEQVRVVAIQAVPVDRPVQSK